MTTIILTATACAVVGTLVLIDGGNAWRRR